MLKHYPICNTKLNDNVKFCIKCGANLENPQQSPPLHKYIQYNQMKRINNKKKAIRDYYSL